MPKSKFNLNILKGRLAEQLVQDLFINSGYNVYNHGLERLLPGLSNIIRHRKGATGTALRFMPDFVVQSSQSGDLFYMEVKYRSNGRFSIEELHENYPYSNAWFVIVSPHKIQCMHYKRLKSGYEITPDTHYSLGRVKSFHIPPEMLQEYEEYAKIMFGGFGK